MFNLQGVQDLHYGTSLVRLVQEFPSDTDVQCSYHHAGLELCLSESKPAERPDWLAQLALFVHTTPTSSNHRANVVMYIQQEACGRDQGAVSLRILHRQAVRWEESASLAPVAEGSDIMLEVRQVCYFSIARRSPPEFSIFLAPHCHRLRAACGIASQLLQHLET